MIDALSLAITALSLVTALAVAGVALAGHFRRAVFTPPLVIVQVALAVQAALDVVGLARGHDPREQATHLAYLVASLLVLPPAAVETRRVDSGWSATILVIALVVTAVLVVRLQTTWRSA